jgi:SAM-dependent methyltransferase
VSCDPSPRDAGEPARVAATSPVVEFYDLLAEDYHLVYGDRWDDAVNRQGAALDHIIRDHRPHATDVLDCSCGIGTQAIGLALRGYRVRGSDISERSIIRARDEAARFGADIPFEVADFRDLDAVGDDFDVVMSCDNAIPHLLDDADVTRALRAMRSKLRPGGLLLIGMRDYDTALIDRPATSAAAADRRAAAPPLRPAPRLGRARQPALHRAILRSHGHRDRLDARATQHPLSRDHLGRARTRRTSSGVRGCVLACRHRHRLPPARDDRSARSLLTPAAPLPGTAHALSRRGKRSSARRPAGPLVSGETGSHRPPSPTGD